MKKLLSKIDTKLCDILGIDVYSALIVGIYGILSFSLTCFVLWEILDYCWKNSI